MKRKRLNILTKLTVAMTVMFTFSSCREEGGLAPEYMPDMYRSPSIETYVDYGEIRGKQGDEKLMNTSNARLPVNGTIARGYIPYGYENTPEGYELAGQHVKNPIPYSEEAVKEGEALFGMFCVHCHGKTGQGDGTLVQREKYPPLPVKFSPTLELPEGKMYHTITYGKGLMGSHASQLTRDERWKLIHYIRAKFMEKVPVNEPVAEVTAEENMNASTDQPVDASNETEN